MGFVSCLEDNEERRDDNEALRYWRTFTNSLAPRHRREERRKRATIPPEEMEEAIKELGDPFRWPKEVIRRLEKEYQLHTTRSTVAQQKWGRCVEALKKLHPILNELRSSLPGQVVINVRDFERRLSSVFMECPGVGVLSSDTFARLAREAGRIREASDRLQDDIADFLASAPAFKDFADDRLRLSESLDTLSKILEQLDHDFDQTDRVIEIAAEVQAGWERFLQLRAVALRPVRPRLEELSHLDLTPEQVELVKMEHAGAYRIQGSSGSGKTLILIHRALRLAIENPSAVVRVFTINQVLVKLLVDAMRVITQDRIPANLNITSLSDFYFQCLQELGAPTPHTHVDSIARQHSGHLVFDKYSEFFGGHGRQPKGILTEKLKSKRKGVRDKTKSSGLYDAIVSRSGLRGAAASHYLREEIAFIQAAVLPWERHGYTNGAVDRRGRAVNLEAHHRERFILVLILWERWLADHGLWDHESIAQTLCGYLEETTNILKIRDRFPTHHVLVDEVQDASTVDLGILRCLTQDPFEHNRYFFVGDLNQKVHSRHHAPLAAGFELRGRAKIITKNHRNTEQILEAAFCVVRGYEPQVADTVELLPPTPSPYQGPRPLIISSSDQQHAALVSEIALMRANRRVAILTPDAAFMDRVMAELRKFGGKPILLPRNGDTAATSISSIQTFNNPVFIARLESAKGFEFDTVIAAHISEGVFPRSLVPHSEWWREAAALYTALTRARDELFITHVGRPSRFLLSMAACVDRQEIGTSEAVFDTIKARTQ